MTGNDDKFGYYLIYSGKREFVLRDYMIKEDTCTKTALSMNSKEYTALVKLVPKNAVKAGKTVYKLDGKESIVWDDRRKLLSLNGEVCKLKTRPSELLYVIGLKRKKFI